MGSSHREGEVNLTIPAVHAEISSQAIAAGKHVWTEKPISVDRASGRDLLAQAAAAGLLVGVAPDTVLGPGMQTARRARTGKKPLASGELGFHVLDTLVAIEESIVEDRMVPVESRVDRVPLVAADVDPFAATL